MNKIWMVGISCEYEGIQSIVDGFSSRDLAVQFLLSLDCVADTTDPDEFIMPLRGPSERAFIKSYNLIESSEQFPEAKQYLF